MFTQCISDQQHHVVSSLKVSVNIAAVIAPTQQGTNAPGLMEFDVW